MRDSKIPTIQATIGTSAIRIWIGQTLPIDFDLQNNGASAVYIGTDSGIASNNGIKITSGGSFSSPASGWKEDIWLISDLSSDVRVLYKYRD